MSRIARHSAIFVALAILGLYLPGCEPAERNGGNRAKPASTTCGLGAAPSGLFAEVDSDGDGGTTAPLEIEVRYAGRTLGRWPSVATFFSVRDDRITRLVITPMPEAASLEQCIECLKPLSTLLPDEEAAKANSWLQTSRSARPSGSEPGDRISNRFVLDDQVEIFVECVATGRDDLWYASIEFYFTETATVLGAT